MSFCINWFGSRYPQNDKYLKRKIPKKTNTNYKMIKEKLYLYFEFLIVVLILTVLT